MKLLPDYAVTTKEIAEAEGLHIISVARISAERDFPKPLCRIGRAKIYDWRQVNRFFRTRKRRKAA